MNIKELERQDFLEYINENWTKESDKIFIEMYSTFGGYKDLGVGLGLYDNGKLIGFIFYKIRSSTKYWRLKKQYPKIWWIYLLEVHPDYRNRGLGSYLLREIYDKMPKGYCLVLESEHTDKHLNFYINKNGFVKDNSVDFNDIYFLLKYKPEI